eukprot:8234553-Pyramimonas_sp.AAC.1
MSYKKNPCGKRAFLASSLGGLLGPSWRPGPSGGHLGRLGAILGLFGLLLDCSGGLLGPSETILRALKMGPRSSGVLGQQCPGCCWTRHPQGPLRGRARTRIL